MATNMATGDPIYHQNTVPLVNGRDGILITSSGHTGYNTSRIDVGINLHSNHEFQSLFSRLVSLENEVFALRKKVVFMETNPQLEEQFESLKRAGEEYRLIEKLVYGPTGERNGTS